MKKITFPSFRIGRLMECAAALLLAAAVTGCAYCEVKVSDPPAGYVSQVAAYDAGEEVIALLDVEVSSWKLFGFIPIVSGNFKRPNSGTYTMFRDYATERYAGEVFRRWGTDGLYGDRTVVTRQRDVFSGWWSLWIINFKAIRLEGEVLKF